MKTYKINIAGVERELERFPISDTTDIAAFILFGDVEITEKAAAELLKRCPEHDVIVTAEAKSIPLVYEMARIGCRHYVVARKRTKVFTQAMMRLNIGVRRTTSKDHGPVPWAVLCFSSRG